MALNLTKGSTLNLVKKDGHRLSLFSVGLNWGAIPKKSFWGTSYENVDLDGSVALFDAENKCIDIVYYRQLLSLDKAIKHSGDELTGDFSGDDKRDNEVITLNLTKLNPSVAQVVFILNSYRGQDFADIPYAHIRLYEGDARRTVASYAQFNVAAEQKYKGHISMILGKLYKQNGDWHFKTIGEPTRDANLNETISTAQRLYL
jgi:tellurium resistance protein TerZ